MLAINCVTCLDPESILYGEFSEFRHDWQFANHSPHVSRIIRINDRLPAGMRHGTAPRFVKVLSDIDYSPCRQFTHRLHSKMIPNLSQAAPDPSLASRAIWE